MSVFYIVVSEGGQEKVVTMSNGHPREFPKRKKAQNFINGRAYLGAKNAKIVPEIDGIEHYFKVDL